MYLCGTFFHHTYAGVISEVTDVSIFPKISITFKLKQVQMLSPKFLPGFALLRKIAWEQGLLNKEWGKVFTITEMFIYGQMVKK